LIIIIAFFIANVATRYKIKEKIEIKFVTRKKAIRSWQNVLANGLPILIFSILEGTMHASLFTIGYVTANASFLCDTVSTEIGITSKEEPFLITNFKKTLKGRSGAITTLGTLAGTLSATLLAIISYLIIQEQLNRIILLVIIVATSSTLANLIDSLLGATIQAIYYCKYCATFSEEEKHTCGNLCEKVSGFKYINNHVVNFLANLTGALISVVIYTTFCIKENLALVSITSVLLFLN